MLCYVVLCCGVRQEWRCSSDPTTMMRNLPRTVGAGHLTQDSLQKKEYVKRTRKEEIDRQTDIAHKFSILERVGGREGRKVAWRLRGREGGREGGISAVSSTDDGYGSEFQSIR